jgi:AhpD family alkylhydroperoxidase
MITEIMREPLTKTIKYVRAVSYHSARGLTAEVYHQLQTDFIPAPLVALHSPLPEVMAGVWSVLRETLMAGKVSRPYKEAVAVTVSKANECPFCVDAHTVMLRATSDHDVVNAVIHEDHDQILDPQMQALVQWAGSTRISNTAAALPWPFSQEAGPEIIGTAVAFHYLNRMANVFLGDSLLPVALPSALKDLSYRLYAATEGRRVIRRLQPGSSLKFLPQAQLPGDLDWAASDPVIGSAFAGFAQVVEQAGRSVLPDPVRALVTKWVRAWNGETPGMSRRWVDDAVAGIREEYHAAARLTLLTALASYQVDSGIIDAFRVQHNGSRADAGLIAATAWASLTAARRAGEWTAASSKAAS